MNLLSIGAAYGVIVAIVPVGLGRRAPRRERRRRSRPWVPMMLFAIVFGLSMDYEVFLISAIREHYDRDARQRVRPSPKVSSRTARVITAAALIMVFVFGSFVVSDVRALKLIGLGLAVAVAIDAIDRPDRARARDDGAARRRRTGGCRAGCAASCRTSTSTTAAAPSSPTRPRRPAGHRQPIRTNNETRKFESIPTVRITRKKP